MERPLGPPMDGRVPPMFGGPGGVPTSDRGLMGSIGGPPTALPWGPGFDDRLMGPPTIPELGPGGTVVPDFMFESGGGSLPNRTLMGSNAGPPTALPWGPGFDDRLMVPPMFPELGPGGAQVSDRMVLDRLVPPMFSPLGPGGVPLPDRGLRGPNAAPDPFGPSGIMGPVGTSFGSAGPFPPPPLGPYAAAGFEASPYVGILPTPSMGRPDIDRGVDMLGFVGTSFGSGGPFSPPPLGPQASAGFRGPSMGRPDIDYRQMDRQSPQAPPYVGILPRPSAGRPDVDYLAMDRRSAFGMPEVYPYPSPVGQWYPPMDLPSASLMELSRNTNSALPELTATDWIARDAAPDSWVELTGGPKPPPVPPATEYVERTVQVPQWQVQEILRHIPRVQVQEVIREVPVLKTQVIERIIDVPQVEYVERVVEVPRVQYVEKFVDVPCFRQQEIIREVLVPSEMTQEVVRRVPVPQIQTVERFVDVPEVQYVDKIIEVPEVHFQEILQPVPRVEAKEVLRHVPVPQVRQVEKIVEVPQIEYVERIVEIPQVQIKEVTREVPRVEIQEVIKHVPKIEVVTIKKYVDVPEVQYVEKIVEVPEVRVQEVVKHVPQVQVQEVMRPVPRSPQPVRCSSPMPQSRSFSPMPRPGLPQSRSFSPLPQVRSSSPMPRPVLRCPAPITQTMPGARTSTSALGPPANANGIGSNPLGGSMQGFVKGAGRNCPPPQVMPSGMRPRSSPGPSKDAQAGLGVGDRVSESAK